ncbi:MAG: hypothetical protein Q9209_007486 [Squamulea sp. 1 TL-2023]
MASQFVAFVEFEATKSFEPSPNQTPRRLKISKGDWGRLHNVNPNGWSEISMQNPYRRGWVPSDRIKTRNVYRDQPMKVNIQVTSLDLAPNSATAGVATSLVEKAIGSFFYQVKQAMQTTTHLTFLREDATDVLATDQKIENLKNTIVHGMPRDLLRCLNQPNYRMSELVNCERVKENSGSGIYARIYKLHDNSIHVDVGSSIDMWSRGLGHESDTRNSDRRHYRLARQSKDTRVIVLTRLENHLLYAEQAMIQLFGSYFQDLITVPKMAVEDEITDWVSSNWEAYSLTKVSDIGFRAVGWVPVTRKMDLGGCNISSPILVGEDHDKLIWVRTKNREGTVATIRRRSLKIASGEGKNLLFGNQQIQLSLDSDEELVEGKRVHAR